ncbi:MAG: M1 family metallopeptidase [Flammeovirgaceae bacterium]
MRKLYAFCVVMLVSLGLQAQDNTNHSKFRQLWEELPTPNNYRTASGAPGHEYWQQRADYEIDVELDEEKHRITGKEKITYTNNSPDELRYIWVQLDQNMRAPDSDTYKTSTGKIRDKMTWRGMQRTMGYPDYDGGHKIQSVTDAKGNKLPYTIVSTMMRVDLPQAVKKGDTFVFNIEWYYNINDRNLMGGRGGYETFEDGNTLYTITQWFPRMAVYDDVNGWQHKQFLGRGEFTLPFGDYKVNITVPADHIVASTGELQNAQDVLTKKQRDLFEKSKKSNKPVIIVSQKEVEAKEKTRATDKKTWTYHAENVRDFAFGSSRKFIWDAMGVAIEGKTVMAMSYYPKEANPLYETYSTEVVAQTLKTYSKYTIPYPYPVAISVEASNGMEYPMICFNYGRPEKDGTYSERIKYGMIGVIIHEVGHNFFPMIINSDERQWTWMDEGLNSFVQHLTEQEWEEGYPSRRGPAHKIVNYMKGSKKGMVPIMTNSESIPQFGNNAYGKPATALNILRETVMGRELFDYAFKEYCRRWAFRHPQPADLFRTMEDASGMDLDWFWRGWFYTTDNVDISLEGVTFYEIDTKNPDVEKPKLMAIRDAKPAYIADTRNKDMKKVVEENKNLADFYNSYDPLAVTKTDRERYQKYVESLGEEEKELIKSGTYFYELELKNIGGLIMPVIVELEYEDGSKEIKRFPAEIWRMNNEHIFKIIHTTKKVKQFTLDPLLETADTDVENNYFPPKPVESRFEIYKRNSRKRENPMQQAEREKKSE